MEDDPELPDEEPELDPLDEEPELEPEPVEVLEEAVGPAAVLTGWPLPLTYTVEAGAV